ncbi:glycosyl hydrolase [Mucilaginibacter sp. CAU 1740]|uniref:glycosyl hydrolase n=1 Tax=Mucilaginibacter sp. CAU 1740 TaxID=3140365 RepID=UPI00325A877C
MYNKKQFCQFLLAASAFISLGVLPSAAQVAPFTPSSKQLNEAFGAQDKIAFMTPAKVYYPETWFHFIGGNVAKEGITADLEAIAGAGTSSITLFHGQFGGKWPGVDPQITCLSPLWEDAVKHAATEAKRLGLKFSMENCPGWAMSGGPWIKPENAMRELVWSRKDITATKGKIKMQLPMPQPSNEEWRDYKNIAVLAFPRPLGDDTLKLASVKRNGDASLEDLLLGKSKKAVALNPFTKQHPNWFEVAFAKDVVIRTIQLPSVNSLNTTWAYEPAINIKVQAITPDGKSVEILNKDLPQSNFQDDVPLSLACSKDIRAKKFKVIINNKYRMNLSFINFSSAAKENNWETEAAWVLRSVGPSNEQYSQNKKAYVDPITVRDISSFVNDEGVLEWTAPPGQWTILRVGHVNAGKKNGPAPPEGTGWECDKLSANGANAQFAGYIGRLSGSEGPLKNGLLTGMIMDSWECGSQTWTANMETEFQQRTQYSLRKWLPALMGYVLTDQETTFRFLRDWKGVINDLFTNNFYGRMTALAKKNNLSVSYETSAGDVFPGDIMEYYKFADVPMCEFWQPITPGFVGSLNFKPIKPCASAARLYGKPRVAAEAFTSFDLTYDEQWQMLKEVANVNMAEGVTHLVYHTYTHNPRTDFLPPGTSFGAHIGTPFLRGETWWKHMPYLNAYFARCGYLLERGKPVSDVLWYLGDEIDHKPDQNAAFLEGFKYDYCNPDALLHRLSVTNGMITTPDGLSYKVLWLPATTHMLPQTLEKLNQLVRAGAVVIGNAPKQLGTLVGGKNAQQRFSAMVKSIWGNENSKGMRNVGKGTVIARTPLSTALNQLKMTPDVGGDSVLWVHRKIEGADWYFVAAPKGKAFKGKLDFRTSGNAEIWDPVNGSVKPVTGNNENDRTSIDFDLTQGSSCFVVFNHNGKAADAPVTNIVSTQTIGNNWTLEFPDNWGAPRSVQLNELKPWKDIDMPEEGKAFSGTATYTTTFDATGADVANSFILNLGKVAMIAKGTVNGKDVGTVWSTPYQLDISKALTPGKNTLQVEVTSTWFNRLVYDANQPEEKRKTWTIDGPSKDEQLRTSGLLGPVTLLVEKTK